MATPQSGQRADAGLDRRMRKTEDDIRQLRERFSRPQKIPEAPTGPVVAGISHWYSGAADIFHPGGVTYYVVGGAGASLGDYSSEADTPPGPVSGIVTNEPGWEGYFKLTDAGLYSFRVLTRIALDKASGTPLVVRLALERDAVYNDHEKLVPTIDGNAAGVPNGTVYTTEQALWDDWSIGMQWVQAGERFHPRLSMKLDTAPAIGPNGGSFTVEVTRYAS